MGDKIKDEQGKVFLIGAGPGDYRLITTKGLTILKQADIVFYDRLVNPSLLSFIKPEAEKIYVGKARGEHSYKQDNINEVIVAKAREGCKVVRLKGGDPFVFGRGGEEALYLKENGIDFEIIPGISAVISGPAYAGIPVTHRGISSSFHVITGHNADKLDYSYLATLKGTIVILMGLKNIKKITDNLIQSGLSPEKPVAVVYYGTTSNQLTVTAKLKNIAKKVKNKGLVPPVLTVIGGVVNLREKLNWFKRGPLSGKRIMVTRPRQQRLKMGNMIEELGGEVFYYPTIEIEGPVINKRVQSVFNSITEFDWIFFTSSNGVKNFFAIIKKLNRDIRELSCLQFAVIGEATKEALQEYGIKADFMPGSYTSKELIKEFTEKFNPDKEDKSHILLPRTDIVDNKLQENLESKGYKATNVCVYKTKIPEHNCEYLITHLQERGLDLLTFTSPSTVNNFKKIIGSNFSLVKDVPAACIGPVTAGAARKEGFNVTTVADEYTVQGLVAAIEKGGG